MADSSSFSLSRKRRLLIVGFSMAVLLILMFVSIEPEVQHSIDEVMDDPSVFEGQLHVRGEYGVLQASCTGRHGLHGGGA